MTVRLGAIWRFVRENLTLAFHQGTHHYEVDLERFINSAAMLDWIFQIEMKTWATDENVRNLLRAFRDTIDPQANLCSFGGDKTINPQSVLNERMKKSSKEI